MRKGLAAVLGAALVTGLLSSCALAQSSAPVVEPGGCGNASFLSGTAYPTMDSIGRGCQATSPSTLGWYSFANITGQSTTAVKASAGVLHTITFNAPIATETITIFDSLSGSGSKIGTITVPASPVPVTLTYDVNFTTGLTIVTAAASSDITVSFK